MPESALQLPARERESRLAHALSFFSRIYELFYIRSMKKKSKRVSRYPGENDLYTRDRESVSNILRNIPRNTHDRERERERRRFIAPVKSTAALHYLSIYLSGSRDEYRPRVEYTGASGVCLSELASALPIRNRFPLRIHSRQTVN